MSIFGENATINDGTILTLEGLYKVYVNIQDGIELIGSYRRKAEACQAWISGHKLLNHTEREPKEMPFYIEEEITQRVATRRN